MKKRFTKIQSFSVYDDWSCYLPLAQKGYDMVFQITTVREELPDGTMTEPVSAYATIYELGPDEPTGLYCDIGSIPIERALELVAL